MNANYSVEGAQLVVGRPLYFMGYGTDGSEDVLVLMWLMVGWRAGLYEELASQPARQLGRQVEVTTAPLQS